MSEENGERGKNTENDEVPGFLIRLPFGLGWLRGNGNHLAVLMPVIRWVVVAVTVVYLAGRVLEGMKR